MTLIQWSSQPRIQMLSDLKNIIIKFFSFCGGILLIWLSNDLEPEIMRSNRRQICTKRPKKHIFHGILYGKIFNTLHFFSVGLCNSFTIIFFVEFLNFILDIFVLFFYKAYQVFFRFQMYYIRHLAHLRLFFTFIIEKIKSKSVQYIHS